ncbi:MAG: nucleotidyltransferase domain-containing protein, partial [Ilumatobacteraceae bacterium]
MDVAAALGTYLEIVDSVAPGMVEGLYVVGSFALDDWQPGRSDIDIVAVTAEPATDEDFGSLRTVHALLAER